MVATALSERSYQALVGALGKDCAFEVASFITAVTPQSMGGDPTGVVASDAAFSRALASAGHVHIPGGHRYRLANPLALGVGQTLSGDGSVSEITYDGSGAAVIYEDECLIQNLKITGAAAGIVAGSMGLNTEAVNPVDFDRICTIRNVRISGFTDGIRLNFNGVISIENPYIIGCTNGVRITGSEVNAVNICGGEIRECDIGILDDATTGYVHNFRLVTIEGNATYGYRKAGSGNSACVTFDSCYFEANDSSSSGTDISVSQFINVLVIRGCFFAATTNCVNVAACTRGSITDSYFAGDTTNLRLGASCRNVTEARNFYSGTDKFSEANDSGSMTDRDITPRPYGTTSVIANDSGDDYASLQLWLDANPTHAHLPRGTYYVSQSLVMPDGQLLTGDGWANTVIRPHGGMTSPVLVTGADCTVRDIKCLGSDTASSVGIKPGSTKSRFLLDRVWIQDFATGLLIDSAAEGCAIRNSRIASCGTNGISISANAQRFLADNVWISNSGTTGISISGGMLGGAIRNCYITASGTQGILVTAETYALRIDGNTFISNGTYDVLMNTTDQRATSFEGNRFTTATGISFAFADATVIEGNVFGCATAPISITNAAARRTQIGINHYPSGVAFSMATMNSGSQTSYLGTIYASASPSGTGPWETGEVVRNSAPTSGQPTGWVCTTGHASSATFAALANLA